MPVLALIIVTDVGALTSLVNTNMGVIMMGDFLAVVIVIVVICISRHHCQDHDPPPWFALRDRGCPRSEYAGFPLKNIVCLWRGDRRQA